jgi:alkanesulfonate monooxygenase SsuD/methylene tetrahydromethanopterin reductase-like flavin-dependent oxidoreductase (luciferase family)/predicted kinase
MVRGDETTSGEVVLPAPCLVVLVGTSGSGKSTWAAAHFAPAQVVSSDALRAVVGAGEDDISASDDAFLLLEQIVDKRIARRLTTVVDTLGLDPERRRKWVARAHADQMPCVAVTFPTPVAEARAGNRYRKKSVPQRVLSGQARLFRQQHEHLVDDGFDIVLTEAPSVRTAPAHMARAAPESAHQRAEPMGLRFGLQLPTFEWPGGAAESRARLTAIARAAEDAGFASLWLMDHYRQIPMFGPPFRDMPDPYTLLAFIAAQTRRIRLGTLVTGITQRPVAQLGKIIATLDVLSEGRANCGLGVGWYAAESAALGIRFPPLRERYALLEDALEFLPLFWGKGAPSFEGRVLHVPEALCYPRPLQEHVPMLVGGNGERRTLGLAAHHADACNIIGEADVVARKVDVLRSHCELVGRDPATLEVTQLSTTLVGRDATELAATIDRLRPRRTTSEAYATRVNAGTVADQIGRFRALAHLGVGTAIVSLPALADTGPIERFAEVITAFATF